MFGSLGVPELVIIFFILLLLFGARKLPELGKGLGAGIRSFKKGLSTSGDETEESGSAPSASEH